MEKVICKAKEYIVISEDKINIKHCRKLILYHNEELWIKKGVSDNFDNPMSSFDGLRFPKLLGAYCYKTSIVLLTPATLVFIEMMD